MARSWQDSTLPLEDFVDRDAGALAIRVYSNTVAVKLQAMAMVCEWSSHKSAYYTCLQYQDSDHSSRSLTRSASISLVFAAEHPVFLSLDPIADCDRDVLNHRGLLERDWT